MALKPSNKKTPEEQKADKLAAQDDVLMREIDDAVRQDEFARLAKTWGTPILGLLVIALIAFGGYLFWDARQEAAMERSSENLVAALDQYGAGNLDSAAEQAAALAADSEGGAAAAALMLQAGIALQNEKPQEAEQLFGQVATSQTAPPALRDLALIRQIAATYDRREPEEVIARLGPLAVPGNPFFGSAGEMVAMAYMEQGERQKAGTLFAEIAKNEDVPETLRSRARQMAGLLGVDAIEDVDELLEEQGVGPDDAATGAEAAPTE